MNELWEEGDKRAKFVGNIGGRNGDKFGMHEKKHKWIRKATILSKKM
jgi:hypothetical protein